MAQSAMIVDFETFRPHPGGDSGRELTAGTTLLRGQYTLTGYLDAGGFGITYRAIDSLGRSVVVKECFPADLCRRAGRKVLVRNAAHASELASIISQFVAEARSLARLDHRGIVKVHQVFMENETAYMAMDFIDGPDLLTLIETEGRALPPERVETIARRLLRAVGYVHDCGLLHRDIAPDNVLLGRDGEPRLIDFGSARGQGPAHDETPWQLKCVKDGYSPDEFYDPDRRQGVESDLYSLGATLHHLIAGRAPVDAEMRRRALRQGQGDPYEPLAGRVDGYTPGFLASVDAALAFDPESRPRSVRDWARSIGRAPAVPPLPPMPEPLYEAKVETPEPPTAPAAPRRRVWPLGALVLAAGVLLTLPPAIPDAPIVTGPAPAALAATPAARTSPALALPVSLPRPATSAAPRLYSPGRFSEKTSVIRE